MRLATFYVAVAVVTLSVSSNGDLDDDIKAKIDAMAEIVLGCRDIVGINLAVVHGNATEYTTGYGVTNLDNQNPVDETTLFGIASLTKAFAATLLGHLLSKNTAGYEWDTPVRDILGDEMYFPTADMTTQTTLRDLLSHKTGLSPSNFVRMDPAVDREELIRRVRFLSPVTSYKTSYLYNNLMYGVLTRVTEVIGGKSWEDLLQEELFDPLAMTSTTFTHTHDLTGPDIAVPYSLTEDGSWRNVSLFLHCEWGKIGGSGSIMTNAKDMAKWMNFHLNQGKSSEGKEVVSSQVLRDTYTSHNNIPATDSVSNYIKPKAPFTYTLLEYALGWRTGYYRGYPIVSHTGTSWGYGALLTLVPALNIGIHTSVSGIDPSYRGRRALHLYIMDLLMGEEPWLNATTACTFPQPNIRHTQRRNIQNNVQNIPSQPLDHYTGIYGNFAYGNISIEANETSEELFMKFGILGRWKLESSKDGSDEFIGTGQDYTWSVTVDSVVFADHDGGKFQEVTVNFDSRAPPTFHRGLKAKEAPSPPALECPTSRASGLSPALIWLSILCLLGTFKL